MGLVSACICSVPAVSWKWEAKENYHQTSTLLDIVLSDLDCCLEKLFQNHIQGQFGKEAIAHNDWEELGT